MHRFPAQTDSLTTIDESKPRMMNFSLEKKNIYKNILLNARLEFMCKSISLLVYYVAWQKLHIPHMQR